MNNVVVVGDRDSVLGFKVLGVDVCYTEDTPDVAKAIHSYARKGYAIIFVTERLLKGLPEIVERYKTSTLPAIIPILDNRGSLGYGMEVLMANVEKAVGSNILVQQEKEE